MTEQIHYFPSHTGSYDVQLIYKFTVRLTIPEKLNFNAYLSIESLIL